MRAPISTAQVDRFVHDRLPPRSQWPALHYDLPELQLPPQVNLVAELLDRAGEKGWPERPMLRSSRRNLSYAQARDEVDRLCRVLVEDLGVVPGNRVLLRGGNSIMMALAWLAVVKTGAIAVATIGRSPQPFSPARSSSSATRYTWGGSCSSGRS